MIKSICSLSRKSFVDSRFLICQQKVQFHRISQEAKSLPRIMSDSNTLDEFQYFSMKIKDLMDQEQLDYFENVIKKVENINHPVAELMRCIVQVTKFEKII